MAVCNCTIYKSNNCRKRGHEFELEWRDMNGVGGRRRRDGNQVNAVHLQNSQKHKTN